MSSRIIVKGLPKDLGEGGLLQHIKSVYSGNVTDCKVIRKHGSTKSRMFGFIGFKSEADAAAAVSALDKTYLRTKKLEVSLAFPEGDSKIPRPWSATTKRKAIAAATPPPQKLKPEKKKRKVDTKELTEQFLGLTGDQKKKRLKTDNPDLLLADANQVIEPTAEPDDDEGWLAQKTKGVEEPLRDAADAEQKSARLAAETGRLRVLNLPYDTTAEELRGLMEKFGEVSEVTLPQADDADLNRGYGFVEFRFPQSACRALEELKKVIFQGRELRVEGAENLIKAEPIAEELKVRGKCAAKRLIEEKKKARSGAEQSWNLLFVSAATSIDVIAQQLGIDKDEVFDLHATADSFAARAALAETLVLKQTRDWLAELGITEEYFRRTGADAKFATYDKSIPRSKDTIIIKHLPTKTDVDELQALFARYGILRQFTMSPTKTLVVARYLAESSAAKAFARLLLHNFNGSPLYLEWAPAMKMRDPAPSEEKKEESPSAEMDSAEVAVNDDDSAGARQNTLFVTNLDFSTTEDAMRTLFSVAPGFRKFTLMNKTQIQKNLITGSPDTIQKSLGYGFAGFDTPEHALDALKRFAGCVVDDHAINLRVSKKSDVTDTSRAKPKKSAASAPTVELNKKIMVKNLPFEASVKDLRQLFQTFGTLASVRIPKNKEGRGRGFAFVQYASAREAKAAFENLKDTHLLGRHLVLMPAQDDSSS